MDGDQKTTNSMEGHHRWFNALQIKTESFNNVFKTINVLRKINEEEIINIDDQLAGKKQRKRVAEFDARDDKIRAILEVYAKQNTIPTKLRQLHLIAAKLTLDVSTDIQDENVDDDDL